MSNIWQVGKMLALGDALQCEYFQQTGERAIAPGSMLSQGFLSDFEFRSFADVLKRFKMRVACYVRFFEQEQKRATRRRVQTQEGYRKGILLSQMMEESLQSLGKCSGINCKEIRRAYWQETAK